MKYQKFQTKNQNPDYENMRNKLLLKSCTNEWKPETWTKEQFAPFFMFNTATKAHILESGILRVRCQSK